MWFEAPIARTLPSRIELGERRERLLERRRRVVVVRLVQVDVRRSAGGAATPRRRAGCSAFDNPLSLSPIGLPTLVARTMRERLPLVFSHLPMIVSDSPPAWPGTQRE